MIFNENYENIENFVAVLHGIKGEAGYICQISSCNNPACNCGEISVALEPLPGSGDTETHNIHLNIGARTVKSPEPDNAFAKVFHSQMTEEDWQLLKAYYLAYKGGIACNEPVESILYKFDNYAIKNGALVTYKDVLPFDNSLWITLNEIDYTVFDRYCLNPSCDCKDALICFARLPADNGKKMKVKDDCAFFVGYLSRKWVEERIDRIVPMAAFRAALEDRYPDFYVMLNERHEKLRQIYAQSRNDSDMQEPRQLLSRVGRIGRNEPCPCGSGKKYKRCCG